MTKFVAYYRVSTIRQGKSGLGLEAQQAAVRSFVGAGELVGEFTDVESGKRDNRPELAKALALAKKTGATLLIAKLDRLSRNLAFIAAMMESGVKFTACDNPTANELTLHILAAVAQAERKAISARTKDALQAAKARGVKLGNPSLERSRDGALKALKAGADERAAKVYAVIREIRAAGVGSLRGIAAALSARGIQTARGGQWSAVQVRDIIMRVEG